jgi:ribosomal protein L37AE/L43A
MKSRTATIKTNRHVARWALAKLGVRTNYRCPTCLNKDVWRTHESTYFWCMTCPYAVGTPPVKNYEPVSTDAQNVVLPNTIQAIRSVLPTISLNDAIDLLRSLRS